MGRIISFRYLISQSKVDRLDNSLGEGSQERKVLRMIYLSLYLIKCRGQCHGMRKRTQPG